MGTVWRRLAGAAMNTGRNEWQRLLLVAAVAVWGFVAIADEVTEGETHEFDAAVLLAMRNPDAPSEPWGPRWFQEMARDVTGLGGVAVLTFLSLAAAGYLWMQGKLRTMAFLLISVGSGTLMSSLLKQGFDRPRPDLVPHDSYVYSASFPSGHSMMAAIVYLTIGALLARVERRRALRAYFLTLAVVVTAAVGGSRVYLGVHWPTDVMAGWAGGAAWAAGCWALASLLQRRGAMEGTGTAPESGEDADEGDS